MWNEVINKNCLVTNTYQNVHNVKICGSTKEKIVVKRRRMVCVLIPGISLFEEFGHGDEFAVFGIEVSKTNRIVVFVTKADSIGIRPRAMSVNKLATKSIKWNICQAVVLAGGGGCPTRLPDDGSVAEDKGISCRRASEIFHSIQQTKIWN